jgi:prepilin-type N-terminal cleavage/methylation domain-containing protein
MLETEESVILDQKTMNITMNRPGPDGRKKSRGFTLVELLLVLVILALIGGLVLPGIIGKAEGAKVKAAGSQIDRLSILPRYRHHAGQPGCADFGVRQRRGLEWTLR